MKKSFFAYLNILMMSLLLCGCGSRDWEQTIIEEEIIIEGLNGEYDLLFLTDTHMIVRDEADSQEIKDYADSRYEEFRSSEGVPAAEQFDEWMTYANEEELDGVLFGGDMIDYPSDANLAHLKSNLDTLQAPLLYTMGNHDWTYPWDYLTEESYEQYFPLLKDSIGGEASVTALDYGEFVVVAVDNSTDQISEASLSECEKVLAEGKPTIVLLHIPIITQSVLSRAKEEWGEGTAVVLGGSNYGGIYPEEPSQKFMDMITAEDSPVIAVLAGHVHFYDKDYIDGPKPVLQIVGDAGFKGSAVRLRIKG